MTDKRNMSRMLKIAEAARLLGVSPRKAYRMAESGTLIGAVRVDGSWRIKPVDFYQGYGLMQDTRTAEGTV